ncbi:hypothetical protein EDC01DRAFT_462536 [Geopyxis carbonaria]|nr:hypothetical protein EDC01DRAFT_462536 [Geopyxis carbonaria]
MDVVGPLNTGPVVTAAAAPNGGGNRGAGGGGSGAWYASYPLPQIAHQGLTLYTFNSKPLEQSVFMQSPSSPDAPDQSLLQWTGASVVNALCSIQLTSLYSDMSSGQLTDLRAALTSKMFHAHLARTLSLHTSLQGAHPGSTPSDRVLADLFESYVGGMARELGTENFGTLYKWYFAFVNPYITHYRTLYQHHLHAPRPTSAASASASSVVASAEAKARRQNVAGYTSRLMEYAAKNRLEPPKFEFSDNGQQGADIQWTAIVSLGGISQARAVASTKLEAKHLASKEALGTLRAPIDTTTSIERRRKKQERRARGGAGSMGQGLRQPYPAPLMPMSPYPQMPMHAQLNGLSMHVPHQQHHMAGSGIGPHMPPPPGPPGMT